MMHRCFAGILLFVCALAAWPQAPVTGQSQFRLLDIKDGLPSLSVNAIAQDRTNRRAEARANLVAVADDDDCALGRHVAALLDDRDLAEIAMDIQRYRSHSILLARRRLRENRVGKRHRRIRALSAPGQVAGAAIEKPGSKPIAG